MVITLLLYVIFEPHGHICPWFLASYLRAFYHISPLKVLKFNVVTQYTKKLFESWSLFIVPKQLFFRCLNWKRSISDTEQGKTKHKCSCAVNTITHLSKLLVDHPKFEGVVDLMLIKTYDQLRSLRNNKNRFSSPSKTCRILKHVSRATSVGSCCVRLTCKLSQPPVRPAHSS